jgi:flagellar biosynthesis/type III secretory pathway protein FliH
MSTPFNFSDLTKADSGVSLKASFVSFHQKTHKTKPEQEMDETPSVEDQTRKAFEDAYAQGEKAGYEMGLRRVESLAKRLEKQIEEVSLFREELRTRYESLANELALIFAEAIVLRDCSDKKDILASMIRKALDACEERGEIIVRVRSEDAQYVEAVASPQLKIFKDDSLKEPGFVIETTMGDIDGRISTQFEELKNALAGAHGG